MADPTQRFSDRVENYVRFRPTYPEPLLAALQQRAGLTRASTVADVGSGTGIFTTLLLPRVGRVFAVEPNAAMRGAAESALAGQAGFTSVNGTSETTTLADRSVDLITAAQAFHWFKPGPTRTEFVRILRPAGQVALIWNERLTEATPFLAAYENLLRTKATDYDQVKHNRIDAEGIKAFFAPGACDRVDFTNEQSFDLAGLTGRVLSSSYAPNVGHPRHAEFMAELHRIFDQHAAGGRVSFVYVTRLYLGRLS